MDFKALIFDLDGTILDNSEIYESAFREVLKEIGGKTFIEPLPIKGSVGVAPNWKILLSRYKVNTARSIKDLTFLTQEEYLKNLSKVKIQNGFLDFVEQAKKKEVKFALATANDKKVTNICLNKFGLKDIFENIVTLEEVENLKPAPDVFIKASEKLGVLPIDCLVIEDAEAGITAAHAAGIRVACLVYENDGEDKSSADFTFVSYADLAIQMFTA